jgi:flagellar hook-length control protein FliK
MRPDSVTSLRPPAPGRADARQDVPGDGFQALLDGVATRPEPRRCGHDAGRRVRGEHAPDRAARHDEGRRAHGRPEQPAEAPGAAPQPPAAEPAAREAPDAAAVPAVPAADAVPATAAGPVPPVEAAAPAPAPAGAPTPQPAGEPQVPATAVPAGRAPADAVPAADEPPAAKAAAAPAAAAPEPGIAAAAPHPEAEPPATLATEPQAEAPAPQAGAGDTGGEQPAREQPPAQPAPVLPAAQADETPVARPQPAQQPPSPAEPAALADPVAPAAPTAPVQPASAVTGQPPVAPQRSAPLHHAPRAVAQLLHVAIERSRNADSPISHARINLRPAELGGIEIRLQTSSAGVTAQVVADSPDAARLLHQAADDLRRSLERHDVTLLALDVSTSGDDRSAGSAGAEADLAGDRARELHGAPRGRNHDEQAADEAVVLETVQLPDGVHVDVLA